MMQSALYEGTIRHRRFGDRGHRFAYRLFMAYVDLDELDDVFAGTRLWSTGRASVAWLRRADYFGPRDRDWADAVRDAVAERCGRRPAGAVRLLTHPRTLGLRTNPVSFYYCFDAENELEAVLAEVTNTPWDERHLYLVHRDDDDLEPRSRAAVWTTWLDKRLHVSPFLPMDLRYRWILGSPDERLFFHMESHRQGEKVLDATLLMRRREITPRALRGMLGRYPWMTGRVLLGIYWHALLLKLKGVRFHPHPKALRGEPT